MPSHCPSAAQQTRFVFCIGVFVFQRGWNIFRCPQSYVVEKQTLILISIELAEKVLFPHSSWGKVCALVPHHREIDIDLESTLNGPLLASYKWLLVPLEAEARHPYAVTTEPPSSSHHLHVAAKPSTLHKKFALLPQIHMKKVPVLILIRVAPW